MSTPPIRSGRAWSTLPLSFKYQYKYQQLLLVSQYAVVISKKHGMTFHARDRMLLLLLFVMTRQTDCTVREYTVDSDRESQRRVLSLDLQAITPTIRFFDVGRSVRLGHGVVVCGRCERCSWPLASHQSRPLRRLVECICRLTDAL